MNSLKIKKAIPPFNIAMISSAECYSIFEKSVADYHTHNNLDSHINNPYPEGDKKSLLYLKNWIDTVQWHLEDVVRDPNIDPVKGMAIKRRIDQSNQHRTDVVEKIDDLFVHHFSNVSPLPEARQNSETPSWLLDRMSILVLKIWHMQEQTVRTDVSEEHLQRCKAKLDVLLEQRKDMGQCFDELMGEIAAGKKRIKVYRQMKMYNDESLNPVLYQKKS